MPTEPAPIVLEPSGKFSGNDGSWGCHKISVGSPPQDFDVLVSTQIPECWVVLEEGCTESDPSNCTETRGGLFDYSKSSTWDKKAIFPLGTEANLGYTKNSDNGAYGWDTVELGTVGETNATLDKQVIAGIATKDFYLGNLGLAARPLDWTDHTESSPSLLSSLQSQNLIPSLSYGYTAGASYRKGNGNASLTLGGYDASRFKPNDVSFSFGSAVLRQLVVAVQSITVTDSELLSQGIFALIDSTVPHIWLPVDTCRAFEDAFGIVYDPISNLYLVNDTQHESMLKQDASVTFLLANALNGGSAVNITLPYSSFDLEIGPPFLIVDYENQNFSVSQALFPDVGTPSHIVAMTKHNGTGTTGTTNTTSGTPPLVKTTSHKSGGIGTGAIAGIAAAIIILALLAGGFAFWKFHLKSKRQNKRKSLAELDQSARDPEPRISSDSSMGDTKKVVASDVKEVSPAMTPPTAIEMAGSNPFELVGAGSFPLELESGPVSPPELAGEVIRSELSTPEPCSELDSGHPSPDLSEYPVAHIAASSSSTTGFWRHSRRQDSSDGETVFTSTTIDHNDRKGSDDSSHSVPTPLIPRRPSLKHSDGYFRPLLHRRLESSSSLETIGSRLGGGSHPSPYGSPALQPIQDAGRQSPSLESDGGKSGLVSPGPVKSRFEERLDPHEGYVEVKVKEIENRENKAGKRAQ
ncbi:MAG: hypothetical protein Q9167_005132 [Letrouitia subvulpina]